MAKGSYKFNPDSLSYDKVKGSFRKKTLRILSYFLASIVLAILYYIILSPIYNSPEERQLLRQQRVLSKQYDSLTVKYKMLEEVFAGLQDRDTGIYRSIFFSNPVSPFGDSEYASAISDDDRLDMFGSVDNIELVHKTSEQLSKLEAMGRSSQKSLELIRQIATDSSKLISSIPSIQPVENKALTRVGASVGLKIHPFYKILRMHQGLDFTVPIGTEVFATGDGVIATVETAQRGEGISVTIKHGSGYVTKYAHLSAVKVGKGERVKRGQAIALSGDSGTSIWPHLHYEVRKDGRIQNPVNYFFAELTPTEAEIVINLSSNTGQSLD